MTKVSFRPFKRRDHPLERCDAYGRKKPQPLVAAKPSGALTPGARHKQFGTLRNSCKHHFTFRNPAPARLLVITNHSIRAEHPFQLQLHVGLGPLRHRNLEMKFDTCKACACRMLAGNRPANKPPTANLKNSVSPCCRVRFLPFCCPRDSARA